jgi:hypothetical protein
MPSIKKLLQAAAGNAGGTLGYVEDVFSTYLYTGTGSTQTITNGIDLDGEGGLVWTKGRNAAQSHGLWDTDRGVTKYLVSENTNAQATYSGLTAFNSNGFTLGSGNEWNQSGNTFASWTFRKAEKFFDVVTYTGDGAETQTINHSLGSTPGFIVAKRTDSTGDWGVYHRSTADGGLLNTTTQFNLSNRFTAVGDTSFDVRVSGTPDLNANTATYVAYLFAHDAGGFGDDGDESIIKCGSYTGNGSTNGPEIDLGFEPQFLLLKASTLGDGANWLIYDSMRGFVTGGADAYLRPNLSGAEGLFESGEFLANGFKLKATDGSLNGSGQDYIYIAIRRPMKTPESGTEVFAATVDTTATTLKSIDVGFPTDFALQAITEGGSKYASSRLTGNSWLVTNTTAAESAGDGTFYIKFDQQDDFSTRLSDQDNVFYNFKRATGFFDVVCYTGTGVARTVAHNLAAVPDLMIFKQRDIGGYWMVYPVQLGNKYLVLQLTNAVANGFTGLWNNASPTASTFPLGTGGDCNQNGGTYVAYLFATVAGVSKVGSYTGNGASQTIDCGFSAGARFILIKRTDSTGDWYVWDSARGIVAGNDPHLSLNTAAAEVTTDDSIDPDSSGFIVNQVAATNINVSSASYIFLSIA